jgi:NADH-quinone oxidoreductase subunit J
VELVVFVAAATMILGGGLGVVLRPHPVHAALSLVLTLFGIAVLFVAQNAQFLAVIQVIVYAGAIVVLFLFVIMLLGVDRSDDIRIEPFKMQRPVAVVIGVAIVGLVGAAVLSGAGKDTHAITGEHSVGGTLTGTEPNINKLARSLFSTYVFAFEVTSILLIIAVLATVVLTRRPFRVEPTERQERGADGERERSEDREGQEVRS